MIIGTDTWFLLNDLLLLKVSIVLRYNYKCLCSQPKLVSNVLYNAFILEDINTWFITRFVYAFHGFTLNGTFVVSVNF